MTKNIHGYLLMIGILSCHYASSCSVRPARSRFLRRAEAGRSAFHPHVRIAAPKSTASTHEKMARFYLAVRNRLDRQGQTEELLTLLAREELAENANWCAEQRDNGIDFSL